MGALTPCVMPASAALALWSPTGSELLGIGDAAGGRAVALQAAVQGTLHSAVSSWQEQLLGTPGRPRAPYHQCPGVAGNAAL